MGERYGDLLLIGRTVMLVRLSTAIAALLVAVWLVAQGLSLLSFAMNTNGAYASTDLAEVVGTVVDTGSVPFVPRDTVLIDLVGQPPIPEGVQVVPDPAEPVEVGQARTVLVDTQRPYVARYKHADELVRPGDRYHIAGGSALVAALAFGAAGVRVVFGVARQRSQHIDHDRIRFVGHHRHGA